MAVQAGKEVTSVVNAAFLQEVKESNFELWGLFRSLREVKSQEWDVREVSRRFVDDLNDLRDSVGLQFSLEETYGFIEGLPANSIIGIASANAARMQHCDLYLQIHELCEKAEEAQYRGTISRDLDEYLEQFASFDAAFRAHEELEQELIRCGLGMNQLDL